jgi:hypothetical protein
MTGTPWRRRCGCETKKGLGRGRSPRGSVYRWEPFEIGMRASSQGTHARFDELPRAYVYLLGLYLGDGTL